MSEKIMLSNKLEAKIIKSSESKFDNIWIVEIDGVLRVIDKETKTLAQPLRNTQNGHRYYAKRY